MFSSICNVVFSFFVHNLVWWCKDGIDLMLVVSHISFVVLVSCVSLCEPSPNYRSASVSVRTHSHALATPFPVVERPSEPMGELDGHRRAPLDFCNFFGYERIATDTPLAEKDSSVNDEVERLRHSATTITSLRVRSEFVAE